MIKARAYIRLYDGEKKRKTPFFSGYRPTFEFIPGMRTDGAIGLPDKESFAPGESGEVILSFLNSRYLGDFSSGSRFKFYEAEESLGEGEIIEVLDRD